MNFVEEVKGWLGMKFRGITLNIDILNGCVLNCPSCGVGIFGRRKAHRMPIEFFRKILNKAQNENKVRKVQLYAYSEPCMHPDLHLFVDECRKRGIQSIVSTVLQATRCDFAKVIEARPTEFRISFAGLEQMSYYQRPAKPEIFRRKFDEVCKLPRYEETLWTMGFHLYRDNEHEMEIARKMAHENKLKFVVIDSVLMPQERNVEQQYTPQDLELISHLKKTSDQSISRMKKSDYCMCWKQITIDATGMVYLCQLVYEDRFKLGNFLDMSNKEILRRIKTHPFCKKCTAIGANVYQAGYDDFTVKGDPVAIADRRRLKRAYK